jgi:hypothetical protein
MHSYKKMPPTLFQVATGAGHGMHRHSSLRCGRIYSGHPKQVAKLLKMHAKRCKLCADEIRAGVQIKHVDELGYVDPSHLRKAMEFNREMQVRVRAMKLDKLQRFYYDQLTEHLTEDYILNSGEYTTQKATNSRRQERTSRFHANFNRLMRDATSKK